MGGHLVTLIPGQRPGQLPWQRGDRRREGVGDELGLMPVGQADEHQVPGRAFHQGRDRAHPTAEDQVALPVPGHRPIRRLGRPLGDVQRVRPQPTAVRQPSAGRATHRPLRAQVPGQLVPQVTAGLHEQRPVDRLVRHVHHRSGREPPPQPPGDLLRRPAQLQLVLDHAAQPRPPRQLRRLRPARPTPRGPIGGQRPIPQPATVARDLPRDRRR